MVTRRSSSSERKATNEYMTEELAARFGAIVTGGRLSLICRAAKVRALRQWSLFESAIYGQGIVEDVCIPRNLKEEPSRGSSQ